MTQKDLIEIIDILKKFNEKEEQKGKIRNLLKKLYKLQQDLTLKSITNGNSKPS